jgi:GNAT superfamily N-acetyltransferase
VGEQLVGQLIDRGRVTDPADRFILVDRLGPARLMRLRVDDNGEDLYSVGKRLDYHFVPPGNLPDGYLDDICVMVAAGGTVASTHVRANLQRAYLIGYVEEKDRIVGNSSLKNPRPAYIDSVRRQTGMDLSGYVERGYTSVRPEYRGLGIGTKLLDGLTRRAGDRRIFSVIAEDNTATKTIAIRNRTRKVATYFSQKAGKPVGIWMPEWMIDAASEKEDLR